MSLAAVIPLYNKAGFIARAVNSALEQSSPVDEIVIVDDASSDGGMAVAEELARNHPQQRFTLLRRATPGPGGYAARNAAIAATEADWIGFLDADDEWRPDFIATVRTLIARSNDAAGAVFMARQFVRSDGSDFVQTALPAKQPDPQLFDFDAFLRLWRSLNRCPMWTSSTAIRRDVLMRAGMFPAGRAKRGGDKDTWLRVMAETTAVGSNAVGATYYNDIADQVTRSVSLNQRHCLCDTLLPMIRVSTGDRQRLLKWVFNSEIQKYARWMFGNQRIAPAVYRGFYARENPAAYLSLCAMSVTPLALQRALRRVAKTRMMRARLRASAAPSD